MDKNKYDDSQEAFKAAWSTFDSLMENEGKNLNANKEVKQILGKYDVLDDVDDLIE